MRRIIIWGFVFLAVSFFNSASADSKTQRDEFLQAYEILHKGGLFDSSHLQDYILHPYLDYERIKQHLKQTSDQTIVNFIKSNQHTWLADNLRNEILVRFAKQKKWNAVLDFSDENTSSTKAKCAILEAKIHTDQNDELIKTVDESIDFWLSGNSRPKNCNSFFTLLRNKGFIDETLTWQRINLAMNKGATSLAKALAKYTHEQTLVSVWVYARKKPSKALKNKLLKKDNPHTRQIIAYAIKRLARKKSEQARKLWSKFQKSHAFTIKEKADVESYIGVREAQNHNPYSLLKLASIPAEYRSHDAKLWMARLAIRQGDWEKLLNAINSMTAENQQKDIWQYWKAYSEKQTGQNITVNLEQLATNSSFYGFLAADELNKPYSQLLKQTSSWKHLTPDIKKMPAMQRATELFAIGKSRLAKKEWYWALKKLNKRDKLVAAAYALEINQPFMAIVSVSKAKEWNQTDLRFPMEYQALVKSAAKEQAINPAWVYGIMRRESAFDSQIVSSAKAKGLMQVLPSTAKRVAKKLGIKTHKTSDLLVPEKNARIGAAYLSQMLNRFDGNYVKATASYNAGPHRIPKWLPDFPINAARWLESIPFNETRNYVRAVMSYTTIYDFKLNYNNRRNLRLSQRLQMVTP